MDMRDTLKLLQETAVNADRPIVTRIDGQPRYVLVSKGNTLAQHDLPAPRWEHQLYSLWALIDLAKLIDTGDGTVSVWHDAEKIQLVHDMQWRRDTASFALQESDCLAAVRELVEDSEYSQRELISLLRIKMAEAHLDDLILVLRSLNFRVGTQTQSDVQHASTSMGKSIEQAIATKNLETPLPEDFEVPCRYWTNLPGEIGERIVVNTRIALEVDFAACAFELTPSRDDLVTNAVWAHEQLAAWLVKQLPEGVPVYHGTPYTSSSPRGSSSNCPKASPSITARRKRLPDKERVARSQNFFLGKEGPPMLEPPPS